MKSLSELTKSLTKWVETETIKMQEDLVSGIRNDTPVKTGKVRAGWQSENIRKLGDTGIVKNEVDYIGYLEFGSDTVAPQGMVRNNIRRVVKK